MLTKTAVTRRVQGISKSKDVARAIELSERKYCAVSAMLRNSAAITHSYWIEPVAVPA